MRHLFFQLILILWGVCCIAETPTVCLYAPKLQVDNFKFFKSKFDSYFSVGQKLHFQPFNNCDDLIKFVKKREDRVVITCKEITELSDLKVVLLGDKDGKTTEKFVFVFKKGYNYSEDKKIKIATNCDSAQLKSAISDLKIPTDKQPETLSVPKDIDALFSMQLGISGIDMALVHESSFSNFVRKKQHKLETIETSLEVKILTVLSTDKTDKEKSIVKVIEKMNDEKSGKELLNILGIDQWSKVITKKNEEVGNE